MMLSAVVERVGVAQVDLVLTGSALVVAELDRDAEVFEHPHRATTEVVRRAAGHVVEVAGGVDRLGAVGAERRRLEQVELDLGMRVEREAGVGGLRERALEHVARVGDGGLAVGRRDVAEHARGRVDLAAPRAGSGTSSGRGARAGPTRSERVRPSIAEPSKPSPSANAPSTSAGAIATDFSVPMTSVNHRRTNLTPRSSIVRRTKSRCLSIGSPPVLRRGRLARRCDRAAADAGCGASSRRSSSAQARERSRMISGARAASSAVSNGPARSTCGDTKPCSTSPVVEVVPVLLAVAGHVPAPLAIPDSVDGATRSILLIARVVAG